MQVRTKDELIKVIRQEQQQLRKLGVRRFGLFGSFVRNQQTAESDIDLLVEFEQEKKSFANFMNLLFLCEEILGREVDLVTPESLSPYIGPKILGEVEYVPLNT